jgi:hypothetical protein
MFNERELTLLAGCCYREMEFLRAIEGCNVPTVLQQGEVMAIRVKCIELAAAAKKTAEVKEAVEGKNPAPQDAKE